MLPMHTVVENHKNVSFNIASEASYVYILSGQKFIKNVKNCQFWRFLEKPKDCCQTVLPDMSLLTGKKIGGNANIEKSKYDITSNFQAT